MGAPYYTHYFTSEHTVTRFGDYSYGSQAVISEFFTLIEERHSADYDGGYTNLSSANLMGWFGPNLKGTLVPIPSALWLLGSGLIGIVGIRRKFRK